MNKKTNWTYLGHYPGKPGCILFAICPRNEEDGATAGNIGKRVIAFGEKVIDVFYVNNFTGHKIAVATCKNKTVKGIDKKVDFMRHVVIQ